MKGKDWNFKKFIPDQDDIDARFNACTEFIHGHDNSYMNKMNEGELIVHTFSSGFSRGAAWMRDKILSKIKELKENIE